jgi:hypothetical protein
MPIFPFAHRSELPSVREGCRDTSSRPRANSAVLRTGLVGARWLRCARIALRSPCPCSVWGCIMGTIAADGALPPRRISGNGGVAGSSITREGQSGVGCSRR